MIKSVIIFAAIFGFAIGIASGVYFIQPDDTISEDVTLIDGSIVNDRDQDITIEPEPVVIPSYSPWWSDMIEYNTNILSNLGNTIDRVSTVVKYRR